MTDTMGALIELIVRFEGCKLSAYRCPAGVWTCGYGATGPGIGPGTLWTAEQARTRMESDAARFIAGAAKLCPNASGMKLVAVADFAFNLGLTRLSSSTLRRMISRKDWVGSSLEIKKWIRAGGVIMPGLVARRAAESRLLLLD